MGIRERNGPVSVGRGAGSGYLRAKHPAGLRAGHKAGDRRAIADKLKRHIIKKAGPVSGSAFFMFSCGKKS